MKEYEINKTALALNVFDSAAELYQQKFMDVSLYHESLDVFCSQLSSEHADVLDIACGPGNVARYLLQKLPGLNIVGIDLSPKMIELAQLNNPEASFRVMNCRDIRSLNTSYHGIIGAFGLPYLDQQQATELVRDSWAMLQPGGILYLSTMEDDYSKSGLVRSSSGSELYMHFHEGAFLRDLLESTGFTIVFTDRKHYTGNKGEAVTDLLLIAAK